MYSMQTFEQRWAGASCEDIRLELDRIAPAGTALDGPQAELAFAFLQILKQRGNTDIPGIKAAPMEDKGH